MALNDQTALNEHSGADGRSEGRLALLREVTQIPTAAGREQGVIDFIRKWVAERPGLELRADKAGNLVVTFAEGKGGKRARKGGKTAPPLLITAHLDHPAFVVERVDAQAGRIELSFRGGVNEVFFDHAPITIHAEGGRLAATIGGKATASSPAGEHYLAELDEPGDLSRVAVGDIATWAMPGSEIDEQGILHTPACDDLAAAAAALAAMDELLAARQARQSVGDVRLLFTRSEEIGFIGAIAACELGTIPKRARVLALENSRAFPESPVGGGPIVRVGDRLSIFTPWLTAACAQRAAEIFGGPDVPRASQSAQQGGRRGDRPWQRKLMSGGACEASVFCHYGYDATCLCLPLGNYHNMPHLDELQSGTYDATVLGPPRCEREFIHTRDYLGLVDLLVGLGRRLPEPSGDFGGRLEEMYLQRRYVLGVSTKGAEEFSTKGAKRAKGRKRTRDKAKQKSKQKLNQKRARTRP